MLHTSCVTVEESLHPALPGCLGAFLGHAHALYGDRIDEWAREKRLGPVIYGVGGAVDEYFTPAFLEECRQSYFNMIGRSHFFLREANRVTARLRAYHIESLAWRGSVHGRDLYGDAGVRYGTDLDILVRAADQRRALRVLVMAGYRLRERAPPAWFLARHHLHWPMVSFDGRVPIDVHWTVDHPYTTGPRVSTDVFLDRRDHVAPILLAALHAEKESRMRTCADEDELRDRVLRTGPVWPWLDLALMIDTARQKGHERELERLAEAYGAEMPVHRARAVVARWFGVGGDTAFPFETTKNRLVSTNRPWATRLALRIGCRPEVLLDWVDYIRESESWVERGVRCLKVLRLAGDTVIFAVHDWGKRRKQGT